MQSLPKNEKLKLILLGVAALILVVISLLFLDQRAANLLTEEQALNSYRVTRELTDIGETGHWFALAFLCILLPWMYLKYARSVLPALRLRLERLQLWGNTFLLALIGAGLAVHLIKFAFGRAEEGAARAAGRASGRARSGEGAGGLRSARGSCVGCLGSRGRFDQRGAVGQAEVFDGDFTGFADGQRLLGAGLGQFTQKGGKDLASAGWQGAAVGAAGGGDGHLPLQGAGVARWRAL
jgi:hypothetical protein